MKTNARSITLSVNLETIIGMKDIGSGIPKLAAGKCGVIFSKFLNEYIDSCTVTTTNFASVVCVYISLILDSDVNT